MTSPDAAPDRPFDGYAAIRWAVTELGLLTARLDAALGADDDSRAFIWDRATAESADLYQCCLADYGQ